jgi:hypothetical protein
MLKTAGTSTPRFAVRAGYSLYDGRDAMIGTTYRTLASACTLAWARHLMAREIALRTGLYDDEASIGVWEWRDGRWVLTHPDWDGTAYVRELDDFIPF